MAIITWPVEGGYATSYPTERGAFFRVNWINHQYMLFDIPSIHEGDDIVRQSVSCYGDPVYAIADGVVFYAQRVYLANGKLSSWGQLVEVDHPGIGISSRYAHLSKMLVETGDHVFCGQCIGYIGSAEGALVPHLHFAICVTDRMKRIPTDWPSNYGSQARSIIDSNYVDPHTFIQELLMNPDTTDAARKAIAALPTDAQILITLPIPEPRDPVMTVTSFAVKLSELASLLPAYVPPITTPPPAVDTITLYVTAAKGLLIRSTPVADPTNANRVGNSVLEYGKPIVVEKAITTAGWCKIAEGIYKGNYTSAMYLSPTRPT